MLYSLKELVFGLNEFEKAKIDDRINQAFLLVPKLKLERLEDFEILEENIYKLKEQLRIKSSNLNRVIKSSKLISKKQVLNFIKDLENIRYEFLKQVFSNIQPIQQIQTKQEEKQEPEKIEKNPDEIKIEQPIKEIKQETIQNKETGKENKITLKETQEYTLIINNGKIPYLTINFKNKFDLTTLKNLSSKYFEIYQMHGSNIIIENKTALIVPRFQNDNLITLPTAQNPNLEEIHKKLTQTQTHNQEPKQEIKEEKQEQPIQKETEKPEEYIRLGEEFKKQEFTTKKLEEDSLDALLTKHQETTTPKDEPNITKPENNNKITYEKKEKDDKIEIEKKPEEIKTENPEDKIIVEHKETPENLKQTHQFEIYRDEHIVAYFSPNSKSFGQLNITTPNSEPISKLGESNLSYVSIFSKVFASVLFELLECHGTNIIYNLNENFIQIIPRFQEDKLPLAWELVEAKPEILNQIKEKLLTTILIEQEKNKPKAQTIVEEQPKQAIQEIEGETSDEKEKRAKHLLDSLRRIP